MILPLEDVLITEDVRKRYLTAAYEAAKALAAKGITEFADETFRLFPDGSGEIFIADPQGKTLFAMKVAKGEFQIRNYPMSN